MKNKFFSCLLILLLCFLGYVSTRESHFHYEQSGVINAPADKIFPVLSHFKMGSLWSPFEQVDPNMKKSYTGIDGEVGSAMAFDGNSEAGTGKLELLKAIPNELIEIKLTMTKPMAMENRIVYRLTPEGTGTRFSWAMSGDNGFMGKLISFLSIARK